MKNTHHTLHTAAAFGLGLLVFSGTAAQADTVLDTPRGGWRSAPAQQQDFVQEVHYPAASVNANGKSEASLIRGHIAAAPKKGDGARTPARLIVDGIAIPLLTDEKGGFARPWSFGSGSHGVEVRSPNGEVARSQFYEAQASRAPTRLRIVLSWDSDNTDLDLHVVSPDGQHVFYGARVGANGGALDVDVTTGFGPEIYATPSPVRGAYHVFVNYFGAGDQRDVITTAQVAILQDEGTPKEKQQVFRVPMRKPGELTLVHSFLVP
ncbi:MAG: DUF2135 domain-containing protein [Pseudomonadota bacterium]